MLYLAALPSAYDVAVLLSGDLDYSPALRAVRALGKRTMVASLFGSCAGDLKKDSSLGDLYDVPALDVEAFLFRDENEGRNNAEIPLL